MAIADAPAAASAAIHRTGRSTRVVWRVITVDSSHEIRASLKLTMCIARKNPARRHSLIPEKQ
jgi:hypothetical protein